MVRRRRACEPDVRAQRVSTNPYQSPQKPSSETRRSIGSMKHRCCPECTAPVPWTRLWLRAWIWARWPCQNCGVSLRFDMRRRLAVVAVLLVLLLPICVLQAYMHYRLVGSPLGWMPAVTLMPAAVALAFLIDGVTRATD